jgi:hypothetical protein
VLIDSSHKSWIVVTLVTAAAAVGLWVWLDQNTPGGLTGGSAVGLWYAVAGTALMIFAGLLSAVRKFPRWRLPPRKWWLKGHIWLGLLSGVLILCHSGFRWGGLLERILWIVFGLVLLTGIFGLVLQQFLPRLLATRVPAEAPYEQIPHICAVMRRTADKLVQKGCGATADSNQTLGGSTLHVSRFLNTRTQLLEFYEKQVRPFLSEQYDRASPLANSLQAEAVFGKLATLSTTDELKEVVEQLRAMSDERRLLGEQERLHHWLHGWLFVHIPLSVLLLFLGVAHAVVALYY